jgi:FkbM family methyltransferase
MQGTIRRVTSTLARRGGVYTPLRAFYNLLFLSRATRSISAGPLHATFSTPTHTIMEHVESRGGEQFLLEEFLAGLKADDVVWDVGASFGLYTVLAARKVPGTGSVVAFEPEPRMRTLLEKNLRLNGIRSVSVRSIALGDKNGTTELFIAANPNSGTSSLAGRSDYRLRKKGIPVELRRGDSLSGSEGIPAPTCVKIDVEGGEARVARGMGTLLTDGRLRSLYCEVHPLLLPSFGDTADAFERMLTEEGFTVTKKVPRGSEYHIVCRR